MLSIPSVLAILISDQVISDAASKKHTVVGIFDSMTAPRLPIVQRMGFYARLTDLEGEYKFTIRVVHLGDAAAETEMLIGTVETNEIRSANRLAIMEIALNLPPIPFPKAGDYEFQLFANEDYIGRATLKVVIPS